MQDPNSSLSLDIHRKYTKAPHISYMNRNLLLSNVKVNQKLFSSYCQNNIIFMRAEIIVHTFCKLLCEAGLNVNQCHENQSIKIKILL